MSEQKAISQLNTTAAQSGVLVKLIIFSVSLGIAPLAAYYGSLNYLWKGNSIYAAILAVVAANIILVLYIITAALEGGQAQPSETKKPAAESKKDK